LVLQDLLELQDHQDNLVLLVNQGLLDHKVELEMQDHQEPQDLLETWDQQDNQDLKDQ
jgi:hypothetical protein